jgi:hypothetical protein
MNKEETAALAIAACVILFAVGMLTYHFTREAMEKDAVANGAGHWELVSGSARFAWGPDHAGHPEGCTD